MRITCRRGLTALFAVAIGLLLLGSPADAAPFSATAAVRPQVKYLNDTVGSASVVEIKNTGSSTSIYAIEVTVPGPAWQLTGCPTAPSGWTGTQQDQTCLFRGIAPTTALAPGSARAVFGLTTTTSAGSNDVGGTWSVVVSSAHDPVPASRTPAKAGNRKALTAQILSFEQTGIGLAAGAVNPGDACPALTKSAPVGSTKTVVVCGRNRTNAPATPTSLSSLAGTLLDSAGTFTSTAIPAQLATTPPVVLATWSDATITTTEAAGRTLTAQITGAANQTSPRKTAKGFSATASSNTAPTVTGETFTGAVGNTTFGVGTSPAQPRTATSGNVLTNDTDDGSGPLTAGPASITSDQGGSVAMNADGTFTYNPPAGFTGDDTFTYSVSDGTLSATGTATVTVADMVWYVNNALGTNGTGTSTSPFNTLANLRGTGDVDAAGDTLFLFTGAGNYTGGIPLEASQKLIGQPQDLVVGAQTLRTTTGGANPTITNAAGNGVQLANDVVIRRVNVTGTSGAGMEGSAVTNVDIGPNTSITNSTGAALSLSSNASGTVTIGANITHASATGRSLSVSGRTGGSVTMTGSINDTAGGVQLTANTGATISLSGQLTLTGTASLSATGGGTVTATNALNVVSSSGGAGSALTVSDTTIGAGGLRFQTLSSSGNVNGIVLSNTGSTGGLTVTGDGTPGSGGSIATLSGAGISLTNVGGVVSFTDMTTSNVTGADVLVNGGAANVTYAGTITNQAGKGRSVDVSNRTGGTVLFSRAITDSGAGISLTDNTGGTVDFTGDLTLDTAASPAFTATGGGTVNVTGIANSIATTTGTALRVTDTSIGASGITFESISAGTATEGPVNGIVLDTTGTAGALTVTGDSIDDSGGTIQNATGDAISLTSTSNPSFVAMRIVDNGGNGIVGTDVSGFFIATSTISSNGSDDASDHANLKFTNLTGGSIWSNIDASHGFENNAAVSNDTGELILTITSSVFGDTNTASPGNTGLLLDASGDASMELDLSGNQFLRNRLYGLRVATSDTATAVLYQGSETFGGNTYDDNQVGFEFVHNSSGNVTTFMGSSSFDQSTLTTASSPVRLVLGAGGGAMSARLTNNTIDNNNSPVAPGILIESNGAGTLTTELTSNTITGIGHYGVYAEAKSGSNTLNTTMTSNTITLTDPLNALNGIRVTSGSVSTDTTSVCADLTSNNVTTIAGIPAVRVRQRFSAGFKLEDYAGAFTDDAAVATFLNGRNALSPGAFADHASGGFGGIADCPVPPPSF